PPVRRTRTVVRGLGLCPLARLELAVFLEPALVHGLEAPLRASSRGPHRLSGHLDPDGVRVRRGQDAHGDPSALLKRQFGRTVADLALRGPGGGEGRVDAATAL